MATHLERLARRLEDDPFFLACPLKIYAQSWGLNEKELAVHLGCSTDSLLSLRLCQSPGKDERFQDDIERIAAKFSADADGLAAAVRQGQALFEMAATNSKTKTLLAARDMTRGQR